MEKLSREQIVERMRVLKWYAEMAIKHMSCGNTIDFYKDMDVINAQVGIINHDKVLVK